MDSRSTSRLVQLADIIGRNTRDIDRFLAVQGLPTPSFANATNPGLPPSQPLMKIRDEVIESCTELQALVEGPFMHLERLTSPSMSILMSIQAIYRYNIASHLALNEEIPFGDLAARCGMDEDDLCRLMRLAIANHIFLEPRKGYIAHSSISLLIADMASVHSWTGLVCEEFWPLQHRVIDAMQKWPSSQELDHSAFGLENDGKSFFHAIREDPARLNRFAESMKYLQSTPGFSLEHLFKDLGWDPADSPRLMIDVGGSIGLVSTKLLRRFPTLKCQVQDLPETVAQAAVPSDLNGRLEFRAHNFFVEQPDTGADVYFMRLILHDWPDKYAIQILRTLTPVMKRGSTVIINEMCLPEPNEMPLSQAQVRRGYDLIMKTMFNSRERDADAWAELLRRADPHFSLRRISCSPGSLLSVIEVGWEIDTVS
ncbi:putative O-methyltransferase [Xylaria sp. FL1777]|nr:putative O-methyltransferase [Xylaria sp. FL1777]